MRIHITGNAGAGKTTLARGIGDQLDLPVFHLDQIVWQPFWNKTSVDKRLSAEQRWSEKPNWVIEGVSEHMRQRADIVIVLVVPRFVCIWRCFKRTARYLFQPRPELPENCMDIRAVGRLLKIVWQFQRLVGDQLISESRETNKFRFVSSSSDLNSVLSELKNLSASHNESS